MREILGFVYDYDNDEDMRVSRISVPYMIIDAQMI